MELNLVRVKSVKRLWVIILLSLVCKVASHDQVKLRKHALPPSIHSFNRKGDKYKVYKYKVVSTILNDIYGIEIIYLEKRLHVLVNILAMGSLVWWCCHHLKMIIQVVGLLSRQKASCFGCLLLHTVRSQYRILALFSLAPTPFSDETSLLYNLWDKYGSINIKQNLWK
jgi:hypothetical protein